MNVNVKAREHCPSPATGLAASADLGIWVWGSGEVGVVGVVGRPMCPLLSTIHTVRCPLSAVGSMMVPRAPRAVPHRLLAAFLHAPTLPPDLDGLLLAVLVFG